MSLKQKTKTWLNRHQTLFFSLFLMFSFGITYFIGYPQTLQVLSSIIYGQQKTYNVVQKAEAFAPAYNPGTKEWVLNEWEKIGQRDNAYAVIMCESKFDPWAIGDSGNSRGLYQIHQKYQPQVSTECAFNVECSTKWALAKVLKDGWGAWSCAKLLGI